MVSNLDIFAKVGKAIAHDEVTRFTIENGQLLVGDQVSDFDGMLTVEFSKVNLFTVHTSALYMCGSSWVKAGYLSQSYDCILV